MMSRMAFSRFRMADTCTHDVRIRRRGGAAAIIADIEHCRTLGSTQLKGPCRDGTVRTDAWNSEKPSPSFEEQRPYQLKQRVAIDGLA